MEVERVGRQHAGGGGSPDAKDGQHQNGACDADDPESPTSPTGVAQPHGCWCRPAWPRMQPPFQALLRLEVLDPIGDPSGLGRAKPGAFVPFEQALQRCPGLEGDEQKREDDGAKDAAVVLARRALEQQAAQVHER